MVVWSTVVWLLLFGLYLVLCGSADTVEMVAGTACATFGSALAAGLKHVAHRDFAFRVPRRAILGPAASVLPEAFSVGFELIRIALDGARGHRGVFLPQPFDPGADDPESAARRAVAVIGASLAPRTFVVRGERSERMILHALPPKPASNDTRWLA